MFKCYGSVDPHCAESQRDAGWQVEKTPVRSTHLSDGAERQIMCPNTSPKPPLLGLNLELGHFKLRAHKLLPLAVMQGRVQAYNKLTI